MEFVKKYEILCAKRGLAPSAAAVMAGLSNAAYTGWLKGAKPRQSNILKICRFFDVPDDYFDETEKTATPEGDGQVQEIIRLYQASSPELRAAILQMLRAAALPGQGQGEEKVDK